MTAVKISQLPAGAALAGSELVPVVQGGATVGATVAQFRAGLAGAVHAHAVADTAGLQAALDGKAANDLSTVSNAAFADKAAAAGVAGGGGATLSNAAPQPLGTAAVGTSNAAARADHVHALPGLAALGAAAAVHGHAIADTAGLQAALDGKLAQGKHTVWVPAAAMTPRTTGGAASGTTETASHKVMRRTLDFDAATPEHAQFTIAMPKSWNEGTVSFQALWTATGGSGGVAWGLQAVAHGDGDAMDTAFGTAVLVTDTLGATGNLHVSAESAAVTAAGSPAEGDLLTCQVHRAVADGADTLAADALLLGVRVFYTVAAGNDA